MEPIVATVGVLLVHTPPAVAQCRVVGMPVQTLVMPVIAAGEANTVTVLVTSPQEPPIV